MWEPSSTFSIICLPRSRLLQYIGHGEWIWPIRSPCMPSLWLQLPIQCAGHSLRKGLFAASFLLGSFTPWLRVRVRSSLYEFLVWSSLGYYQSLAYCKGLGSVIKARFALWKGSMPRPTTILIVGSSCAYATPFRTLAFLSSVRQGMETYIVIVCIRNYL